MFKFLSIGLSYRLLEIGLKWRFRRWRYVRTLQDHVAMFWNRSVVDVICRSPILWYVIYACYWFAASEWMNLCFSFRRVVNDFYSGRHSVVEHMEWEEDWICAESEERDGGCSAVYEYAWILWREVREAVSTWWNVSEIFIDGVKQVDWGMYIYSFARISMYSNILY